MKYNYLENMVNDIDDYMNDNFDLNDKESLPSYLDLSYYLWKSDQITGNISGSYTHNNYKASRFVMNNTNLLKEAIEEFEIDESTLAERFLNYEWQDVLIRNYMLGQALSDWLAQNNIKLK